MLSDATCAINSAPCSGFYMLSEILNKEIIDDLHNNRLAKIKQRKAAASANSMGPLFLKDPNCPAIVAYA